MKANIKNTAVDSRGGRYTGLLWLLVISALFLACRIGWIFLADSERFPIATVKVAASYQHVTHKELESILEKHLRVSFFALPVNKLQKELSALDWVDTATVERVWPGTLKIRIVEKKPVAVWGDVLMTAEGRLFNFGSIPGELNIPKLKGPSSQQLEVLQVYEKLSKILSAYGLTASGLQLRDNQTWVLKLGSGVTIYLGKREIETRLMRFCKAFPAVFAEKIDQLASVDLRYPRGMAVLWKQQTGR